MTTIQDFVANVEQVEVVEDCQLTVVEGGAFDGGECGTSAPRRFGPVAPALSVGGVRGLDMAKVSGMRM